MHKVLFVCVHNSARSQMAEEFLKNASGSAFQVESAGFEPGVINPLVVEAMAEMGFDLSRKKTQGLTELLEKGKSFDYVITVCQDSEEGGCPYFPGMSRRLHISFPDPSALQGGHGEKLAKVREIRDKIKVMTDEFAAWVTSGEKTPLGPEWRLKEIPK